MDIQFVTDSQTMDLFPVLLRHVISNNTSYISTLIVYIFLFSDIILKFEDEQRVRDAWSPKRISFKQSSSAKGKTGIIIVCFSSFCFTPLACRHQWMSSVRLLIVSLLAYWRRMKPVVKVTLSRTICFHYK